MKAHLYSLTADGAEQQKRSHYPRNPENRAAAQLSETYLNVLNRVNHSNKYLNI